MRRGAVQTATGVEVYVETGGGAAVLRTEGFGIGRLHPILKALAKTRPMVSSLAGTRALGWKFTSPILLDARQYGVWNYLEGHKGSMIIRIAYKGDVPLSELASASRRFGGVVHYSMSSLLLAEKWEEVKREIKREAAKFKKEYRMVRVMVVNSVSGEQEDYIIPRDELNELLEDIAGRNPFGRYEVVEALPNIYDVGPFVVMTLATK